MCEYNVLEPAVPRGGRGAEGVELGRSGCVAAAAARRTGLTECRTGRASWSRRATVYPHDHEGKRLCTAGCRGCHGLPSE